MKLIKGQLSMKLESSLLTNNNVLFDAEYPIVFGRFGQSELPESYDILLNALLYAHHGGFGED